MTRRERAEARLARRRKWAASRQAKADAGFRAGNEHRDPATGRLDWALVTQPGHIPERARINRAHERAAEDQRMAERHRTAAAGIADQLDRTIFSDDADAPERLAEKAAAIEARADRCKAVNTAFRKIKGDNPAARLAALVANGTLTRAEGFDIARDMSGRPWDKKPFPTYHLTNLRANARRCRERIRAIAATTERTAEAEAAGGCIVQRVGDAGEHAIVTFAEYPGREIVADLKAANFWWSAPSWHGRTAHLPASVLRAAGEAE